MDMADIGNFIGTVGFPIFAFIMSSFFIKYSYDKSMDQNEKALDKIGTLAEAVNNNTAVLTAIAEKLVKE